VVTNLDSTFQIGVELDRSGALALENISTMHRQRRIVIHCQFSDGKKVESRWIGAPVVRGRMADGIIVFTPDCTVEEAVRIVAGLNNAAAQWSGKKVKSASP
jgi:hypothetical protein